jgi:hypothetical protein
VHRRKAIIALGASPPDVFAELATDWLLNRSSNEIVSPASGVNHRVDNAKFLWEFSRKNVDVLVKK